MLPTMATPTTTSASLLSGQNSLQGLRDQADKMMQQQRAEAKSKGAVVWSLLYMYAPSKQADSTC
jgi:hypothetical protein